jgi:hypothetical protein
MRAWWLCGSNRLHPKLSPCLNSRFPWTAAVVFCRHSFLSKRWPESADAQFRLFGSKFIIDLCVAYRDTHQFQPILTSFARILQKLEVTCLCFYKLQRIRFIHNRRLRSWNKFWRGATSTFLRYRDLMDSFIACKPQILLFTPQDSNA